MIARVCILLLAILFPPASKDHLKVLFVGNSLTYTNNLPALVREIAKQDGISLEFEMLAHPDFSLDDHLNDNASLIKALASNHNDFVVAQQGPSALPESQQQLIKASKAMAALCDPYKTKFALYMVWPSLDRSFDRDNSILSYSNAAKESRALLCPAGLAWKYAFQKDENIPLYGPDRFHPGIHGSVLSAMVIYASITNKTDCDFIDRSKMSWSNSISEKELAIMKEATKLARQQK